MKTRVLVASQVRVMREAVTALLAQNPDIEIVGEIHEEFLDDPSIFDVVEATAPDFLIINLEKPTERPSICQAVFRRWPKLKILAVAAGHADSACYWVLPKIQCRRVKTTEEGLLGTLRGSWATEANV